MTWAADVARWYGVLLAASLAFAPWVRLLAARLPDRGATIARPLGLLATIYPLWLLSSLGILPYSTAGLWATILLAGAAGWAVVLRRRLIERGWLIALGWSEGLGLAGFLFAVWLRGFTPQIENTEKPMDIAFLSASARATSMPPKDPWFAGGTINYYYLGYLIHGSLSRLAGVVTSVGFNLALATTFSLALVAAVGLGYNAGRRWLTSRRAVAAGLLAGFLLLIAGNLYAPERLLVDAQATWNANWWDKTVGVGWRSSRIVCDAPRQNNDCPSVAENIDEFPAFSFMLGDFHPHVSALPYTVVALALALNLLLLARAREPGALGRGDYAALIATGGVIGVLYALNSWDYPTYLLVALAACWVGLRSRPRRARLAALATLAISSLVLWLPFYANFTAPVGGSAQDLPAALRNIPILTKVLTTIAAQRGERTSTGEFLTMFGVPWVAALWLLGSGVVALRARGEWHLNLRPVWPVAVAAALVALLVPMPLLILCGVPIGLAIALLLHDARPSPRTIATSLFGLGFLLVLATDVVYIQDLFGRRMNTIFKVYYQTWTLFAIATALALVVLWREARPGRLGRSAVAGAVALVLLAGIAYPAVAYRQWIDFTGDGSWQGLDGLAYIGQRDPAELAGIEWLRANATDGDVILEAAGCSYGEAAGVPNNRMSAFTGVPTVIGWGWHETQWRNGQAGAIAQIQSRPQDVRAAYTNPGDVVLARYGITYIVVGTQERSPDLRCLQTLGLVTNTGVETNPYGGATQPGFPGPGWQLVFSQSDPRGDVAIYQRVGIARGQPGNR